LKIVTRRRNTSFNDCDTVNLLSDVCNLILHCRNPHHISTLELKFPLTNRWPTSFAGMEMLDTRDRIAVSGPNPLPRTQALRCIQIGLLCVQSDPDDRPDISSVVSMLTRDSMELQAPAQPAFVFGRASPVVSQPYEQHFCGYDRSDVIFQEGITVK
jgi:hypothetical protein